MGKVLNPEDGIVIACTTATDGAFQHAHGSLPLVLTGEARSRMHVEILRLLQPGAPEKELKLLDERLEAIARVDPTLFLEKIPSAYPLKRVGKEAFLNADSVWKNYSTWHHRWVTPCLAHGSNLSRVIGAILEAGVHPDDASIWPNGALLASPGWLSDPARLDMALSAGADPFNEPNEVCLFSTLLSDVDRALRKSRDASTADAINALASLELVLSLDDSVIAKRIKGMSTPSVYKLLDFNCSLEAQKENPEVAAILQKCKSLASRLGELGDPIDKPDGIMKLQPVVASLRMLNIDMACHLVELGCNIDDAFIAKSGRSKGILEEAHSAGGEHFVSRITESIMNRQIQKSLSASESAHKEIARTAPPSRRRVSV